MVLGAGVGLSILVLYLRTLAPTVLYYDPRGLYDSVLLQVRSYVLGIPSTTGYPTYIMLGKLFTYLPFGDVAYRVNLASAVYGALAVVAVYALCRVLTGRAIPSAAAALLFGVCPALWNQAIIAEVYTLNTLMVAATLLALFLWRERRESPNGDRYLLLFAFLCGLSLTNHLTSGLLLPAGLLFVWLVERRKLLEWRLSLKGVGVFLLGLAPYLYLPMRSSMDPPLDSTNPTTLGGFFSLVSGSRFGNRMFAYGPAELPGRAQIYISHLLEQFHPVWLLVAVFGAMYLLLRDRAALAVLGFLCLGWLFYALEYNIIDVHVYFIPTYMIVCILIAVYLGALLDTAGILTQRLSQPGRAAVVSALSLGMLLAPLAGVLSTYEAVDRSEDYRGRKTIEAVAADAGRGAAILHNGGSLWYLRYVEERRLDLRLVDPFPPGQWTDRNTGWVEAAEKHMSGDRSVYVLFPAGTARLNDDLFESAGYELRPRGGSVFYEVVESRPGAGGGNLITERPSPP